MTVIHDAEVDAWLEAFARCVRTRDLDGGQELFDPAAAGFGTVTDAYAGLDELVASQWREVWARTEEFAFTATEQRWTAAGQCVVAATWASVGTDGGERRTRSGRATLVLVKSGAAVRATHTHFSMDPGIRA